MPTKRLAFGNLSLGNLSLGNLLLGVVGAACLAGVATAVGPEARLAQERPSEGRFVKVDQGYMVPYTQRIPGTQATIEMVPVPATLVTLVPLPKSDELELPKETRSRTVVVKPFWVGKYEITMEQYLPYRTLYYEQKREQAENGEEANLKLSDADAVTGPTEVYDPSMHFEFSDRPGAPVPTTTQFAARQYTKWLSLATGTIYRLPLRSEWQDACLAGSEGPYHCDETELDQFAVFDVPDDFRNAVVGTKKPNAWGIHDMHGNMAEWVIEDTAPAGLYNGHVACGGHFWSPAGECTASSLIRSSDEWWDEDPDLPRSSWWMTTDPARGTGFRIISPLEDPTAKQKSLYWNPDSERLADDLRDRIDSGRGSLGRVKRKL